MEMMKHSGLSLEETPQGYIAALEIGSQSIKLGVTLMGKEKTSGDWYSMGNYLVAVPTNQSVRQGEINNVVSLQECLQILFDTMNTYVGFPIKEVHVGCIGKSIYFTSFKPSVECSERYGGTQSTYITKDNLHNLNLKVKDQSSKDEIFDYAALMYYRELDRGKWDPIEGGIHRVVGTMAQRCACLYNLYYSSPNDAKVLHTLLKESGLSNHKMRVGLRGLARHMLRDDDVSSHVLLLDVGYDLTEVGYVKEGKLFKYKRLLGVGGELITQHLSQRCQVSQSVAERMKRQEIDLGIQEESIHTSEDFEQYVISLYETGVEKQRMKAEIITSLLQKIFLPVVQVLNCWGQEKGESSHENKENEESSSEVRKYLSVHRVLLSGGGIQFKHVAELFQMFFRIYNNSELLSSSDKENGEALQQKVVRPYSQVEVNEGSIRIDYTKIDEDTESLVYSPLQYGTVVGLRELALEEKDISLLPSSYIRGAEEDTSSEEEEKEEIEEDSSSEDSSLLTKVSKRVGSIFNKLSDKFLLSDLDSEEK